MLQPDIIALSLILASPHISAASQTSTLSYSDALSRISARPLTFTSPLSIALFHIRDFPPTQTLSFQIASPEISA